MTMRRPISSESIGMRRRGGSSSRTQTEPKRTIQKACQTQKWSTVQEAEEDHEQVEDWQDRQQPGLGLKGCSFIPTQVAGGEEGQGERDFAYSASTSCGDLWLHVFQLKGTGTQGSEYDPSASFPIEAVNIWFCKFAANTLKKGVRTKFPLGRQQKARFTKVHESKKHATPDKFRAWARLPITRKPGRSPAWARKSRCSWIKTSQRILLQFDP